MADELRVWRHDGSLIIAVDGRYAYVGEPWPDDFMDALPQDAIELIPCKPEWRVLADNELGGQVVWHYADTEEGARAVMTASADEIEPYSNLVLQRRMVAETPWEAQ